MSNIEIKVFDSEPWVANTKWILFTFAEYMTCVACKQEVDIYIYDCYPPAATAVDMGVWASVTGEPVWKYTKIFIT